MKSFVTAGLLFIAGMVFLFLAHGALEYTNTTGFCVSCHSMYENVYQEYKLSSHYENASGVSAQCADCHVPESLGPKLVRKIMAAKDVYHWMLGTIDTPEKFEQHRLRMAETVWNYMRNSDSRECRSCHNDEKMQAESQGVFASVKHQALSESNKTCIDCHQGITHQLPQIGEIEAKPDQATAFDYDEDYAEEINETCAGCHGEKAEGTMDGEYPRLAGLPEAYIAEQLRSFKHRERMNIPMVPYTTERELPEEDIQQIARYLQQMELPTHMPPEEDTSISSYERLLLSQFIVNIPLFKEGDAVAGKRYYQRECETCHGSEGLGNAAKLIPRLAGQHSEYLKRQMAQFRDGSRLHDSSQDDQKAFALLGEKAALDILAYLAILDDEFLEDDIQETASSNLQ